MNHHYWPRYSGNYNDNFYVFDRHGDDHHDNNGKQHHENQQHNDLHDEHRHEKHQEGRDHHYNYGVDDKHHDGEHHLQHSHAFVNGAEAGHHNAHNGKWKKQQERGHKTDWNDYAYGGHGDWVKERSWGDRVEQGTGNHQNNEWEGLWEDDFGRTRHDYGVKNHGFGNHEGGFGSHVNSDHNDYSKHDLYSGDHASDNSNMHRADHDRYYGRHGSSARDYFDDYLKA